MTDRAQLLNDNEEAMRLVLEGNQVGLWTALPGIVTSVNFSEMTCEVQPALQAVTEDETGTQTVVNLPLLVDVPIVFPSAGGFTLTFPLAVNDEVLVVFSSRCIDAWWQSGGIQQAMEARMHDLSDGFAIPGPKSLPNKISAISTTDVQLRNNAGTSLLSIKADGSIQITAATVNITGNLVVTGEVTAGAIPLTAHLHPGVTAGGAVTGAPIP